jgi:hypothetical protein
VCLLFVAGCGGGARVDANGMTASDRKAAEAALRSLRTTSIPSALVQMTAIAAAAPDVCRIRLVSSHPRRFRLFLFWSPQLHEDRQAGANEPTYTWLDATLGDEIVTSSFRVGHENTRAPRARVLDAHAGDILSAPAADCQLLVSGNLRLLDT